MNWTSRGFRLVRQETKRVLINKAGKDEESKCGKGSSIVLTEDTMCMDVCLNSPMAKWRDEIEAAVNSIVNNVPTI